MSVSMLGPCLCRAGPAVPPGPPSLCLLQLCEKEEEEEELTERSEQDSGINEEPLLTAEQVPLVPMGIPQKPGLSPQPTLTPWQCKKKGISNYLGMQSMECRFECRWWGRL